MSHTFHIPVLGLAFSIDTPLKVARYGISSVVSIVDDQLLERMRKYYTEKNDLTFYPIDERDPNHRWKRVKAYLNMLHILLYEQFENLRGQDFAQGTDLTRYFELLPEASGLKQQYLRMLSIEDPIEKIFEQEYLRSKMKKGAIDVNIMSKVDRLQLTEDGQTMGDGYSDALTALRGYAESELSSSLILSAGMNPRLYSALEQYRDFFPDGNFQIKKKIILKVSDYRSAFIQAKFLAKKGLWVSEFRIESGLNCGGHAFATEGYLLGPILEEFKNKRESMIEELSGLYTQALLAKGYTQFITPETRISVQGGIGTSEEHDFLLNYYQLDATGWGSPFLLVPEATNVDDETLQDLIHANPDDFYISGSSPLGVPFNNFRKSSAERQRLERIARGRPGSPCPKKYLSSNTEFTEQPICTASREYQNLKIKELQAKGLPEELYQEEFDKVTEKACLCVGLASSVYIKNDMLKPRENKAVAICPGPNLAFFSGRFSLDDMIGHIYGKLNLLANVERPNMFLNELNLYIDYLKEDMNRHLKDLNDKKQKYFQKYSDQLKQGIAYYKQLIPQLQNQTQAYREKMQRELAALEMKLIGLV